MNTERNIHALITNFPNLISSRLRAMKPGKLGETNIYLSETGLSSGAGIIDLAFITSDEVHLVEFKKDKVDMETAHQLKRYAEAIESIYPDHRLTGYLVGTSCPKRQDLETALAEWPIEVKIKTIPRDIPEPSSIKPCPTCEAGVYFSEKSCPHCGQDFPQ